MFSDNQIEDGDAFLFADIFFPGLEMVRYLAECNEIKIKIGAINHAGRADPQDFVGGFGHWADSAEYAWHDACDFIFTGSHFHKAQIGKYFGPSLEPKLKALGQPFSSSYMQEVLRHNVPSSRSSRTIIWPHRPSSEKGINALFEIAKRMPTFIFQILSGVDLRDCEELHIAIPPNLHIYDRLSKAEYYHKILSAHCWLSTAAQETFGYSLHEALFLRCPIVAPNIACYPEVLGNEHCYSSLEEAVEKIVDPPTIFKPSEFWTELKKIPLEQKKLLCG